MADSFDSNEIIPTRARVVLTSTGAALVAGDCTGVSLYVYDLSSDFPEDPVYQILNDAAAGYFGGSFSDGSFTYNFDTKISPDDTFVRHKGHRYRLKYVIATSAEGPLNVLRDVDIRL